MKKFTVIILAICILLTSCAPAANTVSPAFGPNEQAVPAATQNAGEPPAFSTLEYPYDDLEKLPSGPSFDYDFLAPSAGWTELVAGEAPAAFSQVSYEFVEEVLEVDQNVTNSIASAGQLMSGSTVQRLIPSEIVAEGGYVPRDILDAAAAQKGKTVKNGTVVVDKASGVAFKVVSPTVFSDLYDDQGNLQTEGELKALKNTYAVTTPQLHEVLKDFRLGEGDDGETVTLTPGNVSGFAPNIEKNLVDDNGVALMSLGDSYKSFKYVTGNYMVNLKLKDEPLHAFLGDGSPIRITVSGGIAIEKIRMNAKYTGFSGYKFAMTLRQESYLVVDMKASLNEEIIIPILGVNVGVGGIGRVAGGVYVIVGLDGTLRVEVAAREFTSTTIGVRGGTSFYVPTSFRPIFEHTFKSEGDVSLTAKINGSLRFGPMLSVKVLGLDLIGAGAFLGTGVKVEADDYLLDVELYGILQIYIKFMGKSFNLANFTPTIFKRKQADTGEYLVTFLEAYVTPDRVSGTIKKDPPQPEGEFTPVPNVEYRVLVVPAGVSFNPNNPGDHTNPKIKKYPADGYDRTNEKGVFFQKENVELKGSDKVYLEFKIAGEPTPYFSSPVSPTLPFTDYAVTYADYFNDYLTGHVQPIRLIDWDAWDGITEDLPYVLEYYADGSVQLITFWRSVGTNQDGTAKDPKETGYATRERGVVYARTDEYGNFDTRKLYLTDAGMALPLSFDLEADPVGWNLFFGSYVYITLNYDGATRSGYSPIKPTMSLEFSRVLKEVPGSYEKIEDGGRIIDRMMVDEYIWIVNPNGTRTVTEEEFRYYMEEFSTQDLRGLTDYKAVPESERDNLWLLGEGGKTLTPVLDADGKKTGAALFTQRVTVEWVWQAHPNPVKITSADSAKFTAAGGSFQVTAGGYAPFAFTLIGAPAGVVIDRDTGLITIPAGLPKNEYSFTIRAEENRPTGLVDLTYFLRYEGNDPSPPDEQVFTLKITELAVMPEPLPTPTPPLPTPTSPSPTPTPVPRTAPGIAMEQHGYNFEVTVGGRKLPVPVTATGSTPITWSLVQTSQNRIPAAASIDPKTGVLTIGVDISAGTYYFTIRAENDAGSDTQECRLTVTEPRTAPVIADEEHRYEFIRFTNWDAATVQINATGSTPITWSLIPTGRYPLPDAVSINPKTGVLTLGVDIATGMHRFTIKTENDVGYDTRDCTLEVKAPFIPIKPSGMQPSGLSSPSEGIGTVMLSSVLPEIARKWFFEENSQLRDDFFSKNDQFAINPSLFEVTPSNTMTIRYDDPRDVYTKDRWTVNGASFVRWQSCAGVMQKFIEWENAPERYEHLKYEWEAGTGTMLLDASPRCDNYHFKAEPGQSKLDPFIKQKLADFMYRGIFNGQPVDLGAIMGKYDSSSIINPWTQNATYLEYGSLLNKMKSQKGGSFLVELDQYTGAMITGKYFVGLLGNKSANLSFIQDGAVITFAGKDIKGAKEYEFFNFAYYPGSFHESAILADIGSGGENFIFSFGHHGKLPGTAAFAITTGIAEGTNVNVYNFDLETGAFTLIAGNVTVGAGGVVTYRNNTMSEYLITTQTIPGAVVPGNLRWFAVIGLTLVLAGAAAVIVIRIRKRAGKPQ